MKQYNNYTDRSCDLDEELLYDSTVKLIDLYCEHRLAYCEGF